VRERTDVVLLLAYLWCPERHRARVTHEAIFPMNIDKRWILVALLASAAVGAAFASRSRRLYHHGVRDLQLKENLQAWEGEGGNCAPIALAP
jgi:hypothetical protein